VDEVALEQGDFSESGLVIVDIAPPFVCSILWRFIEGGGKSKS
jgi:hypothetical protein